MAFSGKEVEDTSPWAGNGEFSGDSTREQQKTSAEIVEIAPSSK
jgi:hypothetical protein